MERTSRYIGLFLDMLNRENLYPEETLSWDRDSFIQSALLHDLGKISVKDSILLKPGRLTEAEYEEMKTHTLSGMEIIDELRKTSSPDNLLDYAKVLIGTHHEWWDGSGYPFGLKDRQIPLQGRIMAIVDVYDALISERPYKKALSHGEAVDIIAKGRGSHFDPLLTDLFLTYSDFFTEREQCCLP
jgi:putative two-component system response regulator